MLRRLELFVRDRKNAAHWLWGLARLVYHKLVVPIRRDQGSVASIARGTMIGTMIGFTPTVGIQMALILAIWWLARNVFRWNFSLALAIGWTWVSNPVTMIPLYYLYFVAGDLALNQSLDFLPFEQFRRELVGPATAQTTDWFNQGLGLVSRVWSALGAEVVVGSAILAPVAGAISYALALRAVRFYVQHRRPPSNRRATH